jgi:hypothetical protein
VVFLVDREDLGRGFTSEGAAVEIGAREYLFIESSGDRGIDQNNLSIPQFFNHSMTQHHNRVFSMIAWKVDMRHERKCGAFLHPFTAPQSEEHQQRKACGQSSSVDGLHSFSFLVPKMQD